MFRRFFSFLLAIMFFALVIPTGVILAWVHLAKVMADELIEALLTGIEE